VTQKNYNLKQDSEFFYFKGFSQ